MKCIKFISIIVIFMVTICSCNYQQPEIIKVYDTIPFYYPVPYFDTIDFIYPVPRDSLIVHHKDSITEQTGIIIQSWGSNKIIKGRIEDSKFDIKFDSLRVIIQDDTIYQIMPKDTIKIPARDVKKGLEI